MMNWIAAAVVGLLLAAACDQPSQPRGATVKGQLQELVTSNATVVGYLYVADKPAIIATFSDGRLQWRMDPQAHPVAQGPAVSFTEADKICVGFEQKSLFMQSHGPERYLVCEAVQPIKHSNSQPRSQDFRLKPGTLFLQYQPPAGTGFTQYYYASRSK
jgi:hypothetical protein